MTLGERIKEHRGRLGYSQERIAELTGTSRQAVTKWESDKSIPCMENLIALSEIFNVSLEALTSGEKAGAGNPAPAAPPKRFLGGIFVLIHFFICVFYCFWHLIVNTEAYVAGIVCSWTLWLCGITVYAFFALAIKYGDFTMIAGYNHKKKYNKQVLSKLLALVCVFNGFSAMTCSMLYLLTPFLDDTVKSLYSVSLVCLYVINLVTAMLFGNYRFKGQLIIED